jgi:hypothetical protein
VRNIKEPGNPGLFFHPLPRKPMTKTPAVEPAHPMFVSTTGEHVLLALLSGHSASVGPEPTPLHPRFHRVAVAQGVVPAAMAGSVAYEEPQAHQFDRQALLLKTIGDMVSLATEDPTRESELFNGDGRPDARAMATRLGFPVKANERDEAWALYTGESDKA